MQKTNLIYQKQVNEQLMFKEVLNEVNKENNN